MFIYTPCCIQFFSSLTYNNSYRYNLSYPCLWTWKKNGSIYISSIPVDRNPERENLTEERTLFTINGIREEQIKFCDHIVKIPCPNNNNPQKICETKVNTPCGKQYRTSNYSIISKLSYPSEVSSEAKKELLTCFESSLAKARKVLYMPPTISPQIVGTTIADKVLNASKTLEREFQLCTSDFSELQLLKNKIQVSIYAKVQHGDWADIRYKL